MIRKMEKKDLDRVSKIWLDTNIKPMILYRLNTGRKTMDR